MNFIKHIDLSIGEPYLSKNHLINKKLKKKIKIKYLKYENSYGNQKLINSIINYENKNGYSFSKENILVTNGSTEGIFLTISTLIKKDDEVIILTPAYPLYEQVTRLCNGKIKYYSLINNNFEINESINKLITNKTKMIIINNPNNPTGQILNRESIEKLVKIAKKYDLYLLLDNCYEQITYQRIFNFSKYPNILDKIIICHSFSKEYKITGLRIGYLICNKNLMNKIYHLHKMSTISVNSYVQEALIDFEKINIKKDLKYYQRNLNYIIKQLKKTNIKLVYPVSAFYLFIKINSNSVNFCYDLNQKYHLKLTPGILYHEEGYIRMSFCQKYRDIKEGTKRLINYFNSISKLNETSSLVKL